MLGAGRWVVGVCAKWLSFLRRILGVCPRVKIVNCAPFGIDVLGECHDKVPIYFLCTLVALPVARSMPSTPPIYGHWWGCFDAPLYFPARVSLRNVHFQSDYRTRVERWLVLREKMFIDSATKTTTGGISDTNYETRIVSLLHVLRSFIRIGMKDRLEG